MEQGKWYLIEKRGGEIRIKSKGCDTCEEAEEIYNNMMDVQKKIKISYGDYPKWGIFCIIKIGEKKDIQ